MDPEFPGGGGVHYFQWLWKYHRIRVMREYMPKDRSNLIYSPEGYIPEHTVRNVEAGHHVRDALWNSLLYSRGNPELTELFGKFQAEYDKVLDS